MKGGAGVAGVRRSIIWQDAGGRTTQTIPQVLVDASAIMAALEAHSNASVVSWWQGADTSIAPAPVSAVFPDVRDRARLTFTDGAGNLANLALVAPKLAIFKPDAITVDPSAIADILAACIGSFTTASGVAVTAYVAGLRGQRGSEN